MIQTAVFSFQIDVLSRGMGRLNVTSQLPDANANQSNYMSYRGLVTNGGGGETKRKLGGQVYSTVSDESVAADSGVFEAASNGHKNVERTDSGNSVGSLW